MKIEFDSNALRLAFRNDKGQLHNENGPSLIRWNQNGQKRCEIYYLNGKCHNENGPAYMAWYENGKKYEEEYWLNGKHYPTKEQWEEAKKNANNSYNGKVIEVFNLMIDITH